MKYIFKDLEKIKQKIKKLNFILLLDFDLTLSPLAKNPNHAFLPKSTKEKLKEIISRVPVVIITGRKLGDIKKKVNIKDMLYVGNHGLEHNLNKLMRYLTDICICLDTRPDHVLYLYHEAYPLTAEDVKMIKLIRPTYQRVGRPSKKDMQKRDIYVNIEDYIDYPHMKLGQYELTKKATKAQKKRLKVHADLYRQQKKLKETQTSGWKKT